MATCKVCKIIITEEPDYSYCSSFCSEVSDSDKIKWLTMQPGDWGYYPCAQCGCTMEDEYTGPGATCSECDKATKARTAVELLKECREAFGTMLLSGAPLEVYKKVVDFLKES